MWLSGYIQEYDKNYLFLILQKNDSLIKYTVNFPYGYLSNKQKEEISLGRIIRYNPKRNKLKFQEHIPWTKEELREAEDRANLWISKLKFQEHI